MSGDYKLHDCYAFDSVPSATHFISRPTTLLHNRLSVGLIPTLPSLGLNWKCFFSTQLGSPAESLQLPENKAQEIARAASQESQSPKQAAVRGFVSPKARGSFVVLNYPCTWSSISLSLSSHNHSVPSYWPWSWGLINLILSALYWPIYKTTAAQTSFRWAHCWIPVQDSHGARRETTIGFFSRTSEL